MEPLKAPGAKAPRLRTGSEPFVRSDQGPRRGSVDGLTRGSLGVPSVFKSSWLPGGAEKKPPRGAEVSGISIREVTHAVL